jgi:drug/metabolite transporter (DMT)-like permease
LNTWLQLLLTTLAWAATFHIGKYLVGVMPPISAAVWRFIIATACLIPLVGVKAGRRRAPA